MRANETDEIKKLWKKDFPGSEVKLSEDQENTTKLHMTRSH